MWCRSASVEEQGSIVVQRPTGSSSGGTVEVSNARVSHVKTGVGSANGGEPTLPAEVKLRELGSTTVPPLPDWLCEGATSNTR